MDTKFLFLIVALVAIPFLWLVHRVFGIGKDALEYAEASAFLFGGYVIFVLAVPAIGFGVIALVKWIKSKGG